ncbi:Pre-mRNA-processing protein 40A [Glycine soja]|uniref:Pre-mRNA-processing protein 40A isoform D n=1 Tax=Glycine soja TaxID=3848 RepID=A0A445H3I8_GLYSO|nr:pre-mRNA-processing protein 40A isoform X2 [Glycine max]XP_028201019.1 pre-mRNA-processing protein 40A-like [Glycine soja]RZB68209.1 Pre-mRNA-processing protein 40A isoform D [Glycine soja]RZB68210.1 Pre-mRNA-processing protein 40A isoform E [Glycine soja]|eukprot:XP_014628639.1 pre-mRNA-processing protein 40A isoform X2 [Glycine max]
MTFHLQFRPVTQAQQGQPFVPMNSQQFGPAGHAIPSSNAGMPVIQGQQLQYSQPMQQLTQRPMQPGHPAPSSQAIPMQYIQTNRPLTSIPPHSQQNVPPLSNHMPGLAVSVAAPHSSYFTLSYGQQQDNANALAQYQHPPQMFAPPSGQPWPSSASQSAVAVTSVQPAGVQSSGATSTDAVINATNQQSLSDWQEHTSADGRRYYYNKRTRQSSWEKPLELMSPIERADASTVWKEFTSSEGRKYYYNKVTQQSTWSIPEELKLAREQAQNAANQGMQSETSDTCNAVVSSTETPTPTAANAASLNTSLTSNGLASSPSSVTPIAATDSQRLVSGLSGTSVSHSMATPSTTGVEPSTVVTTSAAPTIVAGSSGLAENSPQQPKMPPVVENQASQDFASANGSSLQDIEEAKRPLPVVGKNNVTPPEEKTNDDETLVYANKLEAKNAFKALLESVSVQSDWTWEQAMREIINDKRYNALKTLGERKQAFNEYLGQRKKLEAEERRMKQKRAREEFTKMLEECKELTSSMRWSKAISMFENDERFNAVERPRDREDLFESYMVELERKEKENAAEEHRQNIAEYRKFLESCDYVKVNSPWRKIQDRLEDDDRYLRLEKIDRLLVFQDYIRDLEKEEEEQKRIQKDRIRRGERKNRDAFRKLLGEHVSAGILTAKTQWREYCLKVRDLPQYQAVASNTSGSTPKDLFEDVAEDLEKQYHEDKTLIKDTVKSGKITVVTTSVFEEFKVAVLEGAACQTISEINLKLIFEELLERAKEKEEKEAKKRQRLADDFTNLLYTFKDITTSSKWEDCKSLFEETQEYRSIGDESYSREIFEEYITYLKEKAKEKDRKREEEKAKKEKEREEKRKEKEKKEKDREREKDKSKERNKKDETDSDNQDMADSHGYKEEKKKEKDKERKHRKRHQSSIDDVDSEKEEKEESKKSRRHGSERKKSRKHANSPESDNENRHRRHKRDHWDGSRKTGGHEELEDGELGDDAEN